MIYASWSARNAVVLDSDVDTGIERRAEPLVERGGYLLLADTFDGDGGVTFDGDEVRSP